MPNELAEVLIETKEDARNTKRQLGELDKVTGVQVIKDDTIKFIVKRLVVNTREPTGFILGHPSRSILGPSGTPLGAGTPNDWDVYEINDYPGLLNSGLIDWFEFEDVDGNNSLEDSL